MDELPDLSRIVMLNSSHQLQLIDTNTQKVLSHRSFANNHLKFTPDGKFLLSPDTEHNAYILNASDLSTYRKLPPLVNLCFSNDYQYIAGITFEGVLHSWNLKTQQHITKKMSLRNSVGLIPINGQKFLVYGSGGTKDQPMGVAQIYGADGKLLEKTVSSSDYRNFRLAYHKINQDWMIDMPDPYSAVSYFNIINTKTGKIVHSLNTSIDIAGNNRSEVTNRAMGISQGAFKHDETQAAYSTADGMIRFYDFPPPEKIQSVSYHSTSAGKVLYPDDSQEWPTGTDPITSYQVLPDGGVSANTGRISRHQYKPPKNIERGGHIYSAWNIAVSPQGEALIFWSRDQTAERKAGLKAASLRYDYLNHFLEVRNTTNDKTIQTLDSADGIFNALMQSILNTYSLEGVSWSKDEKLVAAYITDGCIGVWNVKTGRRVALLSGAISPSQQDNALYWGPPSTAISPDNKFVAVTRNDGTIYLYSLKTSLPVAQLGNATKRVAMIQFSSDGRTLYGATGNEVRSWKVPESER